MSILLAISHGAVPIAFEPDAREFAALQRNLQETGGLAINELLWSHTTEIDFYDANDSGDSSVWGSEKAVSVSRRTATTLDDALADTDFASRPIKLLKLEAEGAEPEVLSGAKTTLERVYFVTADVGPERGGDRRTTLFEVADVLRRLGFLPREVQTKRLTVLFERFPPPGRPLRSVGA